MKKTILITMAMVMIFMFIGCAGMPKFFEPAEPYCTAEEQKESIIYRYMNPGDTDFILILGMAAYLDDQPEEAPAVSANLTRLKNAVEQGITYDSFASKAQEKFGTLKAVVLSKALENFVGVKVPLSVCDKRLILGHLENQAEIVDMIK